MSQGNDLLQHLRAHGLRLKAETESDGQLLARFLDRRDGSAFDALVARLGPMVWSVCRRVLPDAADAEDAFQATFLVLVKKGSTVNPRDRVGNWLYGVAYHAARKVRVDRAKRHEKERRAAGMAETHTFDPPPTADLAAHVDRELARLPANYRAAVVLCDLEGKTRQEAARHLGWPEGTVAGRLARARGMLAKRLAKYALGVTPAAVAAVFTDAANSQVPPSVLQAAHRLALGDVPVRAAAVSDSVVRSMLVRRLQDAAIAVGIVVAAGLGTAVMVHGAKRDPLPPPPPVVQPVVQIPAPSSDRPVTLRDRLLGRWQVKAGRIAGTDLTAWQREGFRVEFDDRNVRVDRGLIAGERSFSWTVEPGEKPEAITLTPQGGKRVGGGPVRLLVQLTSDQLTVSWEEASRGRGASTPSRLTLVRMPDDGPVVPGLVVAPAPENVVASRLVGTWVTDPELTRRLGGPAEVVRLEITADPDVAVNLAAEFRALFAGRRVYLAGRLKVTGTGETVLPFLLVEHLGNPLLVYFPPAGPTACSPDEAATVMLAPGATGKDDLLFLTAFDKAPHTPVGAYRRVTEPTRPTK